jgi:acetyl esterase/lipase
VRQVIDFWQAPSSHPTPVVFYLHGGGWVNGEKNRLNGIQRYLEAGISFVSVNYRYIQDATAAGVEPPVQMPLHDATLALQFLRSQAAAWNIDQQRIGGSGTSAGACSILWLAFHADLADPNSADPVARESTRLWCAAVDNAQTSLDPKQMKEWIPNSVYGGHAFGFWPAPQDLKSRDYHFEEFLAARERLLPAIREYSPYEHVTADDPPIYLIYRTSPALGQEQKNPTHSANFGVKLQEKLRSVGVPCELVYPGATEVQHPNASNYLIEKLKAPASPAGD